VAPPPITWFFGSQTDFDDVFRLPVACIGGHKTTVIVASLYTVPNYANIWHRLTSLAKGALRQESKSFAFYLIDKKPFRQLVPDSADHP
jgi:hypothetical protein